MKDCIVDDKYGRDTNVNKADYLDVRKTFAWAVIRTVLPRHPRRGQQVRHEGTLINGLSLRLTRMRFQFVNDLPRNHRD